MSYSDSPEITRKMSMCACRSCQVASFGHRSFLVHKLRLKPQCSAVIATVKSVKLRNKAVYFNDTTPDISRIWQGYGNVTRDRNAMCAHKTSSAIRARTLPWSHGQIPEILVQNQGSIFLVFLAFPGRSTHSHTSASLQLCHQVPAGTKRPQHLESGEAFDIGSCS